MNVLIADDHTVVRHGLQEILNRKFTDVEAVEAKDSREAMQQFGARRWDLVLLDINMPGRSGLDVLEEMKRLQPRTPVLVLSAYPEQEFAIRAIKLGASAYLNKQSAFDELIAAVKKALAGGRYITTSLAERMADSLGSPDSGAPHETLSNREFQVLRLIAVGRSIKEIAAELNLSEKTIGTYRARISEKIGLSTNVELTRYALQHNLVD